MRILKNTLTASAVAAALGICSLAPAPAAAVTTIGFENIFPTSSDAEKSIDSYVSFFSATIEDLGSQMLRISFSNNLPTATLSSFIGDVFIKDTPGLLTLATNGIDDGSSAGVDYKAKPGAGALPQGSKVGFTRDFAFAKNGGASNAIDYNETLGIKFAYTGLFASLLDAVDDGAIRFGLHIQGIGDAGDSDAIVSKVSPVPLPAGLLLISAAFAGAGVVSGARRRKA